MIDFQTQPSEYKHWKLKFDGDIATLVMDVSPEATLKPGYELKMNSYDLGVDIELYDAIQRLRFEHPEVKTVVVTSANEKIFCAGANIRMLGLSTHAHKVNFCKFTNETRNSIEDASENSGMKFIAAVNGTAAGGGYELALATDEILLIDDGNSAVSLPEVPLLAVLPGTGGLTRVVDKRKVRRDHADIFCSIEEGARGQRAVDWRLVDQSIPRSKFAEAVLTRATELAALSDRPGGAGCQLSPLQREISDNGVEYSTVSVSIDHDKRTASITLKTNAAEMPADAAAALAQGDQFWPLRLTRELDDALLHLRTNETLEGVISLKTQGDLSAVMAADAFLQANADNWFIREVIAYWKRTMKRVDMSSRSLFTLVEPGSCFGGFIAELLFASDRTYMLDGQFEDDDRPAASIELSAMNFGPLPMSNGISRLETRFLGEPESVTRAEAQIGKALDASAAKSLGLVTDSLDDIDWEDEVPAVIDLRASFSPDALTGMEANLRFAGPETMETKIFGRLTAWQNWIFQRPNAVSEEGALKLYGTGTRPNFDFNRV
ncbi:2,3-epoxybenzoyl-CoA dihydrolase [Marinobacterium mangrovicola]|uniref:2,3-dihydro-2,3-dihydroxybenzoyl-CoA ring cleavage enzyme n=1 Tax=Marinobacterium mangrovicola TaxID=1476959 RepID=A0A4R1GG27_9GAMM|nr:2,3-epoxybenzoyl-CoA dihydrolase [Marinobacterium mangrovicola]TCK06978.1 2,3-dihydro-2,3-dihydroxybenzoyl-CoA ring cleavage enzyme [Marinobacterium mangrovicola]